MLALVLGGEASGKSAYAEALALRLAEGRLPLFYLAAMEATDDEAACRIRRHRAQRAGKGFHTIELARGFRAERLATLARAALAAPTGAALVSPAGMTLASSAQADLAAPTEEAVTSSTQAVLAQEYIIENRQTDFLEKRPATGEIIDGVVLLESLSVLVANEMFAGSGQAEGADCVSADETAVAETTTAETATGETAAVETATGETAADETEVRRRCLADIEALCRCFTHQVIVSDNLFADGIRYDEATERYRRVLAQLHATLSARAQTVTEVVA